MSDWRTRGSDNRDLGVCFFCNGKASHFDNTIYVEICEDPQCLEEALMYGDTPTRDLVDIFNSEDELDLEGEEEN